MSSQIKPLLRKLKEEEISHLIPQKTCEIIPVMIVIALLFNREGNSDLKESGSLLRQVKDGICTQEFSINNSIVNDFAIMVTTEVIMDVIKQYHQVPSRCRYYSDPSFQITNDHRQLDFIASSTHTIVNVARCSEKINSIVICLLILILFNAYVLIIMYLFLNKF